MEKYYTTSQNFESIKDIPLWKNQRDCDLHRIDKMVQDQLTYYNKYRQFTFPGSLVVAIVDNKSYLIDGQHRREVVKEIKVLYPDLPIMLNIEERYCHSEEHVNDIYVMINNVNTNNCMIKDGEIDPQGEKLKDLHVALIKKYDKIWSDQYKKYPYISKNTFDDKIRKIKHFDELTVPQIMRQFRKRNVNYGDELKLNSPDAYKKAKEKGGFYLHHEKPNSKWLDTVFSDLN
jgi:hypothetical protein